MESITKWLQSVLLTPVPQLDLSPLPGRLRGKLRLTPEQLLIAIYAHPLAEWSLQVAARFRLSHLPKGPGGRPAQ